MISPWSGEAELVSPDGQKTARIVDAGEIAMGAPTAGRLSISSGMTLESCNPSMVWSHDSRFLAVPRWLPDRTQQLVVVDVGTGKVRAVPGRYRVLQLESFDAGVLRGVDSPVHMPRTIAIEVTEIIGV